MHKLTMQTCEEYLVAAYKIVMEDLRREAGLDVWVTSEPGPQSYGELFDCANVTGIVWVSNQHCETAIYGTVGNLAFRAMHDLGHLRTGLQFTCADAVALALHQWEEIRQHIPVAWRERCQAVYQADTIMQSLYCEKHGCFPTNRTEFVLAALAAYN